MDEVFIGTIMGFGFDFAPIGWLPCQGQVVAINQYETLYALLGNNFGGDGRTTFGIPDLRGRVPMGVGSGPGISPKVLGQQLGLEQVTLTVNEMPVHTHAGTISDLKADIKCAGGYGDADSPVGNSIAGRERTQLFSTAAPDKDMKAGSIEISKNMTIGNAGGGQAHYNMQPSLVINYCIAWQGLFPPRP